MAIRLNIDEENLRKKYLIEFKSCRQIAKELGLKTAKAIYKRVKEYGIKLRPKREDLYGMTFGKLTVLSFDGYNDFGTPIWKCKCQCGKYNNVLSVNLYNGTTISCGCAGPQPNFSNYEEISCMYWNTLVKGAISRNFEFSISQKCAWDIFLKQERRCALSDEILVFGKNKTASLDRIDSKKGYIENNIQWVHKDINILKNSLPEEKFIKMCIKVAKKFTSK